MSDEVVIVCSDEVALMQLTVALNGTPYDITAVEPVRTIRTAERLSRREPAAMVVALDGTENVAEVGALVENAAETRFIFLVPRMPPRASLARLAREHGSTILSRNEQPIVIVATLVSLLAQGGSGRRGGAA